MPQANLRAVSWRCLITRWGLAPTLGLRIGTATTIWRPRRGTPYGLIGPRRSKTFTPTAGVAKQFWHGARRAARTTPGKSRRRNSSTSTTAGTSTLQPPTATMPRIVCKCCSASTETRSVNSHTSTSLRHDRPLGDRWNVVRVEQHALFRMVGLGRHDRRAAKPVYRPNAEPLDDLGRAIVDQLAAVLLGKVWPADYEGPEILIHDGQLHIIFSASGYWTKQYALGRLTYNGTGSLLSATSWTKASQPVLRPHRKLKERATPRSRRRPTARNTGSCTMPMRTRPCSTRTG